MGTRHLDLGCGARPRNPYARDELYGIDIVMPPDLSAEHFRCANLSVQPIPFPDAYFDSVSAFDFLEHVPRVLGTRDGLGTRLPFVELMAEIHRVLRPGGRLYAITPAVPHTVAFTDPTHVNPITLDTQRYFCIDSRTGDAPMAAPYGYTVSFKCLRNDWALLPDDGMAGATLTLRRRLSRRWRQWRGRLGHLVWEFEK